MLLAFGNLNVHPFNGQINLIDCGRILLLKLEPKFSNTLKDGLFRYRESVYVK